MLAWQLQDIYFVTTADLGCSQIWMAAILDVTVTSDGDDGWMGDLRWSVLGVIVRDMFWEGKLI